VIGVESLLLFIVATLAINLSPGPSIMYVTSVAASRGLSAAFISVAGMSVGIFCHVIAAATGVVTVLAASTTAYLLIKYIGAAYLVYLGVKLLIRPRTSGESPNVNPPNDLLKFFYRGIIVDLFNPKIGLFFLAFMPQFVDDKNGSVFTQSVILGLAFILIGGIVNCCIGIMAVSTLKFTRTGTRAVIERWIPGCVLIGLGARLAIEDI